MSNYWECKTVIVTGGAGMVGNRLSDFIVGNCGRPRIMDDMSRGQPGRSRHAYHIPHPYHDATDPVNCEIFFRDADMVFNLAASVGGLYHNLSHQAEQYYLNHDLQTTPVMVAAEAGVPVFVQVSSVCVYGQGWNNPAMEENGLRESPEKANEGYAWAKRMGERICGWAFANTDTRYMIVRPTNIYGIHDYFDDRAHVIPALIRKFTENPGSDDVVDVYGGDQTREFIYADDVAEGMMVVAEKGWQFGGVYNLGTNGRTVTSIENLARMIQAKTGSRATINLVNDRPTGDTSRSTDSTKAEALGWKAEIGLEEGLSRVIEWYNDQV